MSQIFISYARKDHFFVDRLREDLKQANIDYWIDHEGLSPGTSSWELAIREALKVCESVLWIVSPASFSSAYVRDEISIARMYERKIYPIFADGEKWLECVPLGTGEIQFIDARSDYNSARDKILETLGVSDSIFVVPDEPKPSLPEGQEPRNPYKGLVAFTEKDANDFFGREALVKKLEERIAERLDNEKDRFLAVMGPSGAGKSSVVMAGLIPSLKKKHANWTFLPKIVPGIHPVEALADALYSEMLDKRLSDLESDLNSRGGRMLHRLARQIDAEQVVLYIDQFEEVFTLTQTEDERQQFIDLIVQAATEPDGKMLILLSMRADFYGHPMNYPHLGALVEANNVGVLPMSITELHEAIEKPARLPDVALSFDSGLVAEIVFALRERDKALAGALPLLQFTLERLFAERNGTHLNFAAYEAMGGVQGAIGTHCEEVFSKLPDSAQEKLGQVFLPLINIDENTGEATRRRAELEIIIADTDAKVLVDALIKNRILQTGTENSPLPRSELGEGSGVRAYLEIAHESLFRSWKRLADWIDERQADFQMVSKMRRESLWWQLRGKQAHDLPRPEILEEYRRACQRLHINLTEDIVWLDFINSEKEYLMSSIIQGMFDKKTYNTMIGHWRDSEGGEVQVSLAIWKQLEQIMRNGQLQCGLMTNEVDIINMLSDRLLRNMTAYVDNINEEDKMIHKLYEEYGDMNLKKQLQIEIEYLLLHCVNENSTDIDLRRIGNGFSKTSVVRVSSLLIGNWTNEVIIKSGHHRAIEKEWEAYENYVRPILTRRPPAQLGPNTPILSSIIYDYVGDAYSFESCYKRFPQNDIEQILEDLFKVTCDYWYSVPTKRDHLVAHQYIDFLHCYPEYFTKPLQSLEETPEGNASSLLSPRIRFVGIDKDFPNPVTLLDSGDVFGAYPAFFAITHGDFTANNILVTKEDDGNYRTVMIDFMRTGESHILRDFIQLEVVIKFVLLEHATLVERYELEVALLKQVNFADIATIRQSYQATGANAKELQRAFVTVCKIRELAWTVALKGSTGKPVYHFEQYYFGLFFISLDMVRYLPTETITDGISSTQALHALLAAAMLVPTLVHT